MKWHYLLKTCLIVSLCISCSERLLNKFESYNDLIKSDVYIKGWIPKNIPNSSNNIIEKHDLDTNVIWIKFNANDDDLKRLMDNNKPVSEERKIELLDSKSPGTWWFKKKSLERFKIVISPFHGDSKNGDNSFGYYFIDLNSSIAYFYYPG